MVFSLLIYSILNKKFSLFCNHLLDYKLFELHILVLFYTLSLCRLANLKLLQSIQTRHGVAFVEIYTEQNRRLYGATLTVHIKYQQT